MKKKFIGRYRFLAVFIAVLFAVLIVQLYNLQIRDYEENAASAESKKTKTITSQGQRGTIMDVNSLTLAYDKQIYNIQFYRDPNEGKSAIAGYTQAIVDVIDIVEKNGGTLDTSFSLQQDEMTGLWVFVWNNSRFTQAPAGDDRLQCQLGDGHRGRGQGADA